MNQDSTSQDEAGMTIPIGPLDEVFALTKERAARLTLKVGAKFIDGYLSTVVPHPGGNEAAVRTVFTSTVQLPSEFFHAHFTHPGFKGLLQERGDVEQILFCVLELSASGLRVRDQTGAWQMAVSYAQDTSQDIRAPLLRDPEFVKHSIRELLPFSVGPVRSQHQGSWQLFLSDSAGVELSPGLWLMHTLIRDREKIIVDPARYTLLAPAFFETSGAAVLDFPALSAKMVEYLLVPRRGVSPELAGWIGELLRHRLRDHRLREIDNEAFKDVQAIPFLWQRYT